MADTRVVDDPKVNDLLIAAHQAVTQSKQLHARAAVAVGESTRLVREYEATRRAEREHLAACRRRSFLL